MKKQYLLFLTLAISFVAFGVINPLEVNFLKEGNVATAEAINDAVDCDEANQCTYTFVMTDEFGDGWSGGTMTVFQNEEEVETFGLTGGATGSIEIALCDGEPFSLFWNSGGSWQDEVGITILDAFGEEVYSKPPDTGSPDSELYTGVVDCTAPSCPKPINVEAEVTVDSATISWTEQGDATEWEVIVVPAGSGEPSGDEDDIILTTDNPYTFEDLEGTTTYEFYVRAICDAATDDISGWRSFVFMTVIANDECDAATEVPVNTDATCDLTASGTFQGATLSEDMPGPCDAWSTIYQDVWFEFEATESAHAISILNSFDTYSMYIQVFSDDICDDSTSEPMTCGNSPVMASGLTVGETYKIRVFSTWNLTSSFDICVRTLNTPENDDCDEAIDVPVNTDATCTLTVPGTFEDATLSSIGGLITCYEWDEAVKDVWFEFEATDVVHKVSMLNNNESWSSYIEVFEEVDCNTPGAEPISCGQDVITLSGLTIGDTYKVRVSTYSATNNSTFDICVRTLNAPDNDDCDEATDVPVNTDASCTLTTPGTFDDATLSSVGGVIACYDWDEAVKDVWFEFEATDTIHKVSILNVADTWTTYVEVFEEADCNTPGAEPIACGQGTITLSGLTIGDTYKIRVSTYSATNNSTFDVCVRTLQAPDNDDCDGAVELPVSETMECEETVSGTFLDATLSEGASDGCNDFNEPVVDVWYEFEAITTTHGVVLSTEASAWNVHIEVYEEDICTGYLDPIECGQTTELVVNDLTPGETYKVRVITVSATDEFDFEMCVISLFPPIRVADDEHTVPELVEDVLIGDAGNCTGIENISWVTGTDFNDVNGIAYFEKNGSQFPFENGIVLATCRAIDSEGPSEQPIQSGNMNSWPDDEQLTDYMHTVLGNNDDYHNATILEFDFTPATDSLKFNFIFASNEYGGSFQCSFSDAFAFFLTDIDTGVTENLAIVPDTTDPISVITIRKEIHSPPGSTNCGDANPEYFHELYYPNGQYNGQLPLINPINYRGWTVPMTAESAVTPGKTYRIKMVIQDRGDASFDSAVFLEGGSFDIGSVDLGGDMLIEDLNAVCEDDQVLLDTQLDPEKYTFEWYKDDVLIEGETGPTLIVTETGVYRIEAYYEGNTTCGISDSVLIEIYPIIVLEEDLQDIPVCVVPGRMPEVDITIHEPVFDQYKVGGADFEYSYHLSEDNAKNDVDAIENPEAYTPEAIPVTIYLRVYNTLTECVQVFEFDIIRKPLLDFTPHDDIPICVYPDYFTPTDLTQVEEFFRNQTIASIVFEGYYLDQEDAYDLENPITGDLTEFVVDELPTTIYMAILNEETGCYSFTSFNIVATETLDPQLPEDVVICDGYLVPELPAGQYYSASEFGEGERVQPGTILGEGNHTLYINIENEIGCVFSHRYDIQVIQCTPQRGISPNGDGLNDAFDLTEYHLLELKIFNRDGIEVYSHGIGYTDQWEGQSNSGNLLPDGTYYYHFITPTGIKTGYVQLVREVR
ncbi:choice-of-anchor L domain-containing protein [Avrilella dinanensis]|uniref:Fibronectin type-III domain-containing protein n=1 Tax=Avrilella dinanensis TaxID=2008672 RepID=A0A2M9R555_9FLAO|nr:choice-of-anchor L domain-containing protein [Avrilella dinanensis]PJR03893.1 hypothetical protein CDL10_04665 [Avrilella dinanensis]